MIVKCNNCNSRYNLKDNLIKPKGTKVRCTNCGNTFKVFPPPPTEEEALPLEPFLEETPVKDEPEKDFETDSLFSENDVEKKDEESDDVLFDGRKDMGISEEASDSDVEDEEKEAPADKDEGDEFELDFDFDGDPFETDDFPDKESAEDTTEDEEIKETEDAADEADEFDISDIDKMLGESEEEETGEKSDDDNGFGFGLDLGQESDVPAGIHESKKDMEDVELDFESLTMDRDEEMFSGLTPPKKEDKEVPDLENEFDPPQMILDKSDADLKQMDEASASKKTKEKSLKKPKKVKTGNPILLIFILLLAVGCIFLYYLYVSGNFNIPSNIPFISGLISGKSDVDVITEIRPENINSKFVNNVKSGKIFVITGEIQNVHSEPLKNIAVKGNLYTKGKTLAKEETVIAGNLISDLELKNLEFTEISERLISLEGAPSKFTAPARGRLPFMIVFASLPDNLEEYTIDIIDAEK